MTATTTVLRPCHQPALFRERGLAVPFTSPPLASARVRPGTQSGMRSGRIELELVVPNPSGAAGQYVLAWADRAALGACTVHDTYLGATIESALARERRLTAGMVRAAAREVGGAGYAGRAAAAACAAAASAAARRHAAATRTLTLALVRQMEGPSAPPPEQDGTEALAWRARRCLERVAADCGETAGSLANAADLLAAPFAEIGLGSDAAAAPLPCLIGQIGQTANDAAAWGRLHPDHQGDPAALLAGAAELVTTLATRALGLARRRAANLPLLLRDCAAQPEAALADLDRAESLLDGWERICLLWRAAGLPRERALHLPEMARLVPAMPAEVEAWFALPPGTAARSFRRFHGSTQEAADSLHSDRIARNELLRAMAA